MKLRKRFFGMLGSLVMMTGGVSASEPQDAPGVLPGARASTSTNQQIAQGIASTIAQAVPEHGYKVSVEVQSGVATLNGVVSGPSQLHRIIEATQSRPDVSRVVSKLRVLGNTAVQTASYQGVAPQPEPMPSAPPGLSGQEMAPAVPEHTFPSGAAPQYDMPFMPPFAWPAKAPYPNYSAVQYPKNYPVKSWPYIGPFNPYPEPPLDWREVKATSWACLSPIPGQNEPPPEWQKISLQWRNGHWYMNFTRPWWAFGREYLSGIGHTEVREPDPCRETINLGYHVNFKQPLCTHYYVD